MTSVHQIAYRPRSACLYECLHEAFCSSSFGVVQKVTLVTVASPALARRRVMRTPRFVGRSVSVGSPERQGCAGEPPFGNCSDSWLVPAYTKTRLEPITL